MRAVHHTIAAPTVLDHGSALAAGLTDLLARQELFGRGEGGFHRFDSASLHASHTAWFGVGVTTRAGPSRGLPLDVLSLVYAQELVRRRLGWTRSLVVVADSNAQAAGADALAVRRLAVQVERRLRELTAHLGFPLDVQLTSTLGRLPTLPSLTSPRRGRLALASSGAVPSSRALPSSALPPSATARALPPYALPPSATSRALPPSASSRVLPSYASTRALPPYVAHQLAQTEHLRQQGVGLKLGWAWRGAWQDERYFDDLHAAQLGPRIASVYVGGGVTLDPRRPRACPYVCSDPDQRLLLHPGEDLERKLARAPTVARQRYERLLGKLARAHCHLTGAPRPSHAIALLQDLVESLPWPG